MCCEIFYVYALRHWHAHWHALYQFSDDVCATLYSIDGQRWVSIIFGIDIDNNPLMNKCMNGQLCKQWQVVSDIITLGYINIIISLITAVNERALNQCQLGYCTSSLLSPPQISGKLNSCRCWPMGHIFLALMWISFLHLVQKEWNQFYGECNLLSGLLTLFQYIIFYIRY